MKDTVFQRIMKPLTPQLLKECVSRFQSDYDYETLLTDTHVKAMIYAHLTEIKSLRALEVAINSQKIGLESKIKRSTLSDANKHRPADCFFWLLKHLMSRFPQAPRKELEQVIKIMDSSPIQLKGHGYDEWAKEYATSRCQGLKLHMEYNLQQRMPTRTAVSHPNYNDSSMGQRWPIESNTIYIFDKGYCDFNWWWSIHQRQAFFVTRLKKNASITIEESQKEMKNEFILSDGTFRFKNKRPRGGKKNVYEESLRRISVAREGKAPLVLVTNLKDLAAETIAELYKARWQIELFFKWVKQNLKLKKFLGKSANAVKIQIATALIAYLLVRLFKEASKGGEALHLVLVWIRHNMCVRVSKFKNYPPPIYEIHTDRSFLARRGMCNYDTD